MRIRTLLVVAVMGAAAVAQAEIVDQILATVDTEAILQSEIMMEIGPRLAELQTTAASQEEFDRKVDQLIRDALDQAIENKILLREAMRAGLEIEEERVDERIQELKKLYDSPDEFQKELDDAGESLGDLRTRIRKQTLARAMAVRKQKEFADEVVVSESEVAQYYEDHKEDFSRPAQVRVRQIFLPAPNDEDERAVVKARMEEIQAELKQGGDFADVAQAYSKGPNAEEGGVIGWVVKGDLVKSLENAAFSLSQGEVSDIVESPGGFHILKVDEKREGGQAALEDVRKDIQPLLRAEAAAERYRKWMQELRKESRVRVFY